VVVHAAQQCPAHPNLWIKAGRRTGRSVAPRSGSRPTPGGTIARCAPPVLAGLFDDLDRGGELAGAP
jgi:hypothetical protein